MTGDSDNAVHWSFWAIAAVMLIWNLAGSVNFLAQMNPEILAAYRESEQAIVADRPAWATAAFALAVFAGTFGCLALLFRRSIAIHLFVASFLGVVGTTVHSLSVGVAFSFGEIMGIVLMPVLVAAFLIWYARYSDRRGWIG